MKAIQYKKFGPPEVLKAYDVDQPQPGALDIIIKVHATSVNSGDGHLRSGKPFIARIFAGPIRPRQQTLGTTFSGTVVSTGTGVTRFRPGDEVFGSLGIKSGTYAEYIALNENEPVELKPEHLTHEDAVALVFGPLSALFFIQTAQLKKGEKILIIGASGGVGAYAVQYAHHIGAEVSGICGPHGQDFVTSLGAHQVYNYKATSLESIQDTFDVILDMSGKNSIKSLRNRLKPQGRYLSTVLRLPLILASMKKHDEGKSFYFGVTGTENENMRLVKTLAESGELKPLVSQRFTLDNIQNAHTYLHSGKEPGTIVVTV